jgi:hypothetical protein
MMSLKDIQEKVNRPDFNQVGCICVGNSEFKSRSHN